MKSDNKSGWTKKENNTDFLRMGVVLLSLVSFFTTANGMKRYIFANNSIISYAASAAIQGILLALSMNLPGYLRGIWAKPVENFDITPNKDYEAKPEEDGLKPEEDGFKSEEDDLKSQEDDLKPEENRGTRLLIKAYAEVGKNSLKEFWKNTRKEVGD